MKKYSIFVTIIALAELIIILSGAVGSGPENHAAASRSAAVVSDTVVIWPTPSPKPKVTAAPKRTATPKPSSSFNTYILNTSTKKFHKPTCGSVKQMLDKNKQTYNGPRASVISMGYSPCGKCNP